MPIEEKERPQAVVSVPSKDPEPPKKDRAADNVLKAKQELKQETELVRPRAHNAVEAWR